MPYDEGGPGIGDVELTQILEAARWAPTAHNMQNFEIVAVDDRAVLDAIGRIRTAVSDTFLRENYAQLAFSEKELQNRGTGVLADMFPPAWRQPEPKADDVVDFAHAFLGGSIRHAPLLLVVVYDSTRRAPASEGDVLGFMSLGCVMQNMWLMAEDLGIGLQVLSAFSAAPVEEELRRILALPAHLKVAFACRLGRVAEPGRKYLRVRRAVERFSHRNRYDVSLSAAETAEDPLS
jgi:nitroreductase